jgi:A/G-specific adenine glycosylase
VNDRHFTDRLRHWGLENRRDLPWVGENDPYRIWLSETLLQQTRVEQGLPYYHAFVEAFPRVEELAVAPEDRVLKLWEGLGYYSRARNLLKAARMVVEEFGGRFPENVEDLRRLPGVGAYTAAAVASFAFDRPEAVLDGNVYRVLARYYDLDLEVPGTAAQKEFARRAKAVLDPAAPGAWNQAMMDFGATLCTPRNPKCGICPVADACGALLNGTVLERPVKKAKKPKRLRVLHFVRLEGSDGVLVERRGEQGIWAGLWQFPMWESPELPGLEGFDPASAAADAREAVGAGAEWSYQRSFGPLRHLLSHQDIRAWIHRFELGKRPGREGGEKSAQRGKVAKAPEGLERQWVAPDALQHLAFPRLLTRYLEGADA